MCINTFILVRKLSIDRCAKNEKETVIAITIIVVLVDSLLHILFTIQISVILQLQLTPTPKLTPTPVSELTITITKTETIKNGNNGDS
ncbi:MAG: hypothetical protein QXG46_03385 [Ignisphaera sp.]